MRIIKAITQFAVSELELLPLIDEAWIKRGPHVPGDPESFRVDMGRVIGSEGETAIKIVTENGTPVIRAVYPVK